MKKILVSLFLALPVWSYDVVKGEGYHYVEVSLTDISRIVCPVEVKGVVYSKEKAIEVQRQGGNVFVKFLPLQRPDGKLEYVDAPRELYVECGGKIFSLILIPKKVPAKTIVLELPYAEVEKAREFERASSYEKTMADLITRVYKEEAPPGYVVKEENRKIKEFMEIDLILRRKYEGYRYEIYEYIIRAKKNVDLYEGSFLPYLEKPLALAIVKPSLKEGETTRLIVVSLRK